MLVVEFLATCLGTEKVICHCLGYTSYIRHASGIYNMDNTPNGRVALSVKNLQPHILTAIEYFGYFTINAIDTLSDITMRFSTDPNVLRALKPSDVVGLLPHMTRDPIGATKATVERAYYQFLLEREWSNTLRTKDFLPYMRIRFCDWCPPEWAGKDIVVNVADLSNYPLRHCSLPICKGSVRQGSLRLLKGRELTVIDGSL